MRHRLVMTGTAGWSIPRAVADELSGDGSHLERYSLQMPCTEINSSFYREHSFETYRKWARSTPPGFRFAVKLPRIITHDQQLRRARAPLQDFLVRIHGLGRKLGPLLMQLPPSLTFDARTVQGFLALLRELHEGPIVCEPRHASWFEPRAEAMLVRHRVARVATDPTRIEAARMPGGWMGSRSTRAGALAYYRLHGSPRKYWSRYEPDRIQRWAAEIANLRRALPVWCIFDNTASGAALANALELRMALSIPARQVPPHG